VSNLLLQVLVILSKGVFVTNMKCSVGLFIFFKKMTVPIFKIDIFVVATYTNCSSTHQTKEAARATI
jgi:hypothetical protein